MKQLVSIALSLLLLLNFVPRVAAEGVPTVRLVAAGYSGNTLSVSYRITSGVANQEITALVYSRLADGGQGNLLQVHQTSAPAEGVNTLSLAVESSIYGYWIHLGGTGINLPRRIPLQNTYQTAGLGYTDGQTAEQFIGTLAGLSQVSLSRGAQPLSGAQALLPGDTVTANLNGALIHAYAVIYGDVNLDRAVNAVDALQVLRHAVGKITLTEASLAAADFRQDGVINAVNALEILQFAVGKIAGL